MASAVSSPSTRRVHYQSPLVNASLSLSQSFSTSDPLNTTESFISSFQHPNPLVTIVYSSPSSLKGMDTSRRNSSMSSVAGVKTTEVKKQIISGACTFIRLYYGDNQQILLNSLASCRRLLDHMKPIIGVQQDEIIDLMDNEGKLKELNLHYDEYAQQYLTPRNTYYVLKIETDMISGDKRYTPNFNISQMDQKLNSVLTNSLNLLNKSGNKTSKRFPPGSKQTTPVQLTSTTTQQKTKRGSNKK